MIDDLLLQARYCEASSPLYVALFQHLAALRRDFETNHATSPAGPFFTMVDDLWCGRVFAAWFERPLLLAGALHEQALDGHAPELAALYASCGGHFESHQSKTLKKAIVQCLASRHPFMRSFLAQPSLQTNETSRGLCWLLPLLAHWQQRGCSALTLIELGCSAGLGLVADQYGYQVEGAHGAPWQQAGHPSFSHRIKGPGAERMMRSLGHMAALGTAIKARIGCDLRPLDCRYAKQKRILEALIWPDNAPRLARLRKAMATQAQVREQTPLVFEHGDMVETISRLVPSSGVVTPMVCLFNTVATCYLEDDHYARLRKTISVAFQGPWARRDCLWIEFEIARKSEALPMQAKAAECLIRLHRPDGLGGLDTHYFGAAAAHPKVIEVYENQLR